MSDHEDCDSAISSLNSDIDALRDVVIELTKESIETGIGRLEADGNSLKVFNKTFDRTVSLAISLERWHEAEKYFEQLYKLNPKLFLKNFKQTNLCWSQRILTSQFFKSIGV